MRWRHLFASTCWRADVSEELPTSAGYDETRHGGGRATSIARAVVGALGWPPFARWWKYPVDNIRLLVTRRRVSRISSASDTPGRQPRRRALPEVFCGFLLGSNTKRFCSNYEPAQGRGADIGDRQPRCCSRSEVPRPDAAVVS